MPEINVDCHIMLEHENVNSGNPYGFLLVSNNEGVAFSIQREAYNEGGGVYTDEVYFYMTMALADDLMNPDGTQHVETRDEMMEKIIEFLSERTNISLHTILGTYVGLHAVGHVSTEDHYMEGSVIDIKLGSDDEIYAMIDTEDYLNSYWDGLLNWGSAYWTG